MKVTHSPWAAFRAWYFKWQWGRRIAAWRAIENARRRRTK